MTDYSKLPHDEQHVPYWEFIAAARAAGVLHHELRAMLHVTPEYADAVMRGDRPVKRFILRYVLDVLDDLPRVTDHIIGLVKADGGLVPHTTQDGLSADPDYDDLEIAWGKSDRVLINPFLICLHDALAQCDEGEIDYRLRTLRDHLKRRAFQARKAMT